VSESFPEVIAGLKKMRIDLRLAFQPAEGGGVYYAVAVALVRRAVRVFRFGMCASPAVFGTGGAGDKPLFIILP